MLIRLYFSVKSFISKLITISYETSLIDATFFDILSRSLWDVHSTCTHRIGTQEATATSYLFSATSFLFASYSSLTWESSIITLGYRTKKVQLPALALDMHQDFLWEITETEQKIRQWRLLLMIFKAQCQWKNKVDEDFII